MDGSTGSTGANANSNTHQQGSARHEQLHPSALTDCVGNSQPELGLWLWDVMKGLHWTCGGLWSSCPPSSSIPSPSGAPLAVSDAHPRPRLPTYDDGFACLLTLSSSSLLTSSCCRSCCRSLLALPLSSSLLMAALGALGQMSGTWG